MPVSLPHLTRIFDPRPAAVAKLKGSDLFSSGVGQKAGGAVAVVIGELELGAGMGTFPPADHACPPRRVHSKPRESSRPASSGELGMLVLVSTGAIIRGGKGALRRSLTFSWAGFTLPTLATARHSTKHSRDGIAGMPSADAATKR